MINCKYLMGLEDRNKYDGVWEWHCLKFKKIQCRWKLDNNGRRVGIDDNAFEKLGCTSCPCNVEDESNANHS